MGKIKCFLAKIGKYWQKMAGFYFNTPLPRSQIEHNQFAVKILQTYDFPDVLSWRRVIAAMVMHSSGDHDTVKIGHIARSIRNAQAKEVAFGILQTIKKQEAESEAAQALNEQVSSN